LLIEGDNLEALKALIPFYAGKVKCIYIDPPYNTKSAFEHYDDNVEHSTWLSLIYPRLELLRQLLAKDGTIWISIDDREAHYLKVIMDEIFGRDKFVASIVWQKRYSRENREAIGDSHEYVFVYAMDVAAFKSQRNTLPLGEKQLKLYKNPDNDPKGPWQSVSLLAQGFRPNQMYKITAPNGKEHFPPEGNCWKVIEPVFQKALEENAVYFGKDGNGVPRRKQYLSEAKGVVPWTWWPHEEAGHTDEAKKEANAIFGADVSFGTPKPERLIERILHISTNQGDLVLDSCLGSGTTASVAHKMGRSYIGIEIGEHAKTHCHKRLKMLIDDGDSKFGTQTCQGGGGFRFYKLGEAVFDEYGCLNTDIKFPTLASHIWYLETKTPLGNKTDTPLLGVHNDTAYYLLYNGILGDRRPAGGNVLTSKVLNNLPDIDKHERIVIYGESSRLGEARLKQANITFKQIPYDVGTL
jgi:adenine-specific DNA-methyltransferase